MTLATFGKAQTTFGRFGYGAQAQVPGWTIDKGGFRAAHPLADSLQYPQPAPSWQPVETSATGQTVSLGDTGAGGPTQLREDLYGPGFSLYFTNGIDLSLRSNLAPFLSWTEGTVAQTVPTPPLPWVLLSFRTDQPPILMVFPDTPMALVVEGSAGNWRLKTQAPFQGWVRFVLPMGLDPASPSTAAGLGALSARVAKDQALWMGPSPKLVGLNVEADNGGVVGAWTFDRPGALVPVAPVLSAFGGYPAKILTETMRLGDTAEGPLTVSRTQTLRIRFPVQAWPQCRYLAIGDVPPTFTGGSLDVGSASEAAFASLSAAVDPSRATALSNSLMKYLTGAPMETEPITGQRLPFTGAGGGYDLAAAHALLTQALGLGTGAHASQNPLLTGVYCRCDWYTWFPWNVPDDVGRRASALAAIASSMSADPQIRLQAGMLQAGLSAQRGHDLWRHWRGEITKLPTRLEAMESLRRSIFSLNGPNESGAFGPLMSPLRLCGGPSVMLSEDQGKHRLNWVALSTDESEIELISETPFEIRAAQNLQSYRLESSGGRHVIVFKPKDVGACALELERAPNASTIPPASPVKFVEISR